MQILWVIIELSATAFENYVILASLNNCFPHKAKNRMIPLLAALFLTTGYVTIINQIHIFEGFLSSVTIVLFVLYVLLFLKGKPLMKTILVVIAFSLILGINILLAYGLAAVVGVEFDVELFSQNNSLRLISLFLSKFLFYIAMKMVVKLYCRESLAMRLSELLMALAMFVLTHIVAISFIIMQINERNNELLTFISILSILVTDILIFYLMKKISKENQTRLRYALLELQLAEQKQMAQDARQISQEIKKAEHDLKHHLFSVLGILEAGQTEKAISYLQTMLKEYETSIFKYIFIDNSAINSVLNFKIGRCRASGIDFKLEIESDFSGFEDTDICVLLSNLLDNAIEASERIQEKKVITLSVKNQGNYLCILVRNRIEQSVFSKNGQLKTTKQNQGEHGFGLYSVSQIVDKYEGMKQFYEEHGYFIVDIWLKKETNMIEKHIEQEAIYQTRQN